MINIYECTTGTRFNSDCLYQIFEVPRFVIFFCICICTMICRHMHVFTKTCNTVCILVADVHILAWCNKHNPVNHFVLLFCWPVAKYMESLHVLKSQFGQILTNMIKRQDILLLWITIGSWWRHQMETFSPLLSICAGNSPASGEFPAQTPVTRSFEVFFDLSLNKRLRKQSWGWWFETLSRPLLRHCNYLLTGTQLNTTLSWPQCLTFCRRDRNGFNWVPLALNWPKRYRTSPATSWVCNRCTKFRK